MIQGRLQSKKTQRKAREASALVFLLFAASVAFAQHRPPPGGCADAAKMEKICLDVMSKTSAKDESPHQYEYEEKIYAAACVNAKDDEKATAAKIRYMWSVVKPTCTGSDFEVNRGSILKYALKVRAYDLVRQAAESWNVDLNDVDDTDGRTVLDYVDKEIVKHRGSDDESVLRMFWQVLRKQGAKYARELR